jgi:hypothetical protein
MKPTVYIETTIPSFLTARNTNDPLAAGEQEATRRWWNDRRQTFDLFVSLLVLEEAAMGDTEAAQKRLDALSGLPLLDSDEVVDELTDIIMASGAIPAKAKADAVHVSLASRHNMDFLLTLNCKHIANAQLNRRLNEVISNAGYRMPVICTPLELMGDNNDDA